MAGDPFEKIAFKFDFDQVRNADIYVRWGFEKSGGGVIRAFIGLEIEAVGHRFTVLHYDNSHGQQFHRHSPGFPHSGSTKTEIPHWSANEWVSRAKDEITKNWHIWVNSVVPNDVTGYIASQRAAALGLTALWNEDED